MGTYWHRPYFLNQSIKENQLQKKKLTPQRISLTSTVVN